MTAQACSRAATRKIRRTQFEVGPKRGRPENQKGPLRERPGWKGPAPSAQYCPFGRARFEIRTSGLVAPMSEGIKPLKRGYRSEVPLTMLGFLLCLCPSAQQPPAAPAFLQELGLFWGLRQAGRHNFHSCHQDRNRPAPKRRPTEQIDNKNIS